MAVTSRVQSSTFALLKLICNQGHLQIKRLSHIKPVENKDILRFNFNGESFKYPSVWLRDNCQCDQCFHRSAQSRIINWTNFDVNITPKQVQEQPDSVVIDWNDGHHSVYSFEWLRKRSFMPHDQKRHDTFYEPEKITWNGNRFLEILKRHDYHKVIDSDQHLHDWLQDLSVYGVTIIVNVPSEESAVDGVLKKIGFARKTHYGEKYTVENRPGTSNVAYLSSNLQIHTDLPYYEHCPGVNMLHCLTQTVSEGGHNILTDAHYVANYMRENHRDEYNILSSVEVEWSDVGVEFGNEFHKLHRNPVIVEDKHGNVTRVNFSIPQRGSFFPTKMENVKPWYAAHKLFLQLSHEFSANFKTNSGEMLCFDNIRLLHGRTEYEDIGGNVRKLIGAYLDWDEVYSRLRCLKIKLGTH